MRNIDKELINWAINRIETEYKGEISLLIGSIGACKTPDDEQGLAFDYFIPADSQNWHAYSLSKTFIIDNMGYDLYPAAWERVEGYAELNERNSFCLENGVVIWARSDEDRERFLALQEKQKKNLADKNFVYKKALERIDLAMDLLRTMMFDDDLCNCRKAAANICNALDEALSMWNGSCMFADCMDLSKEMNFAEKPEKYAELQRSVMASRNSEELRKSCTELIKSARSFFAEKNPLTKAEPKTDFEEICGFYEEARYTWRRIYYSCDHNNATAAFRWASYLQVELDFISEDFALPKFDMLSEFDMDNLPAMKKQAEKVEKQVLDVIRNSGAKLNSYADLEEFLQNN